MSEDVLVAPVGSGASVYHKDNGHGESCCAATPRAGDWQRKDRELIEPLKRPCSACFGRPVVEQGGESA